MKKVNQLRAGVLLTYVNMGLGTIIPMFYTPVMLRILGQEEYGLYSLSSSVISYLTLLSFGLGGTIVRYISKYRAEGKKVELEKMAGMALLLYSFLAILVMIGGVFLSNNVEAIFQRGLTEGELVKIKPLILLMAFNTAISFPISVFSSIIVAYEKFIYRQLVNILATVFAPCANLVALYMGYGSIGLALTSTILQFMMLPLYGIYCYRNLKIRPRFRNLPIHLLKEIGKFSFYVFLGSVVDMLFWATDKVILGMLAGTSIVAIYNIGSQFNNIFTNLSTAFSSVLTPKTTIMVANKRSDNELTELFIRVGRMQYILIALALSGFIVFGKNFIELWAGADYSEAYYIALVTLIPLTIPLIQNTGYSILLAENKHKFRSIVYLIIAIVNMISTYLIVPYLGGFGAALCSGISYIIGQGLIMNIYYYKVIKIGIPQFWKNIGKLSIIPVMLTIVGLYIQRLADVNSWGRLFIEIIIYTLCYCSLMYFMSFNTYEKEVIRKPIEKFLAKLH